MAETTELPLELDVHDAAARLDGLLAPPKPEAGQEGETPEKGDKPARAKDPVTGKFVKAGEKAVPKAEDGEKPEPAEDEEEEVEETDEEREEREKQEAAAVRKLKVKLDGMEQEIDEPEVVKGYLRQADYTRKTQELSAARKKFEEEEVPAVREERQYYAQNLERLVEALEALTGEVEPDWEAKARTETPEEFSRQFTAWKANKARAEKVKAEHARISALHEEQETAARAARLAREAEKLGTALPDWNDPEKGKVLREDLTAYAKSLGFSDDDIGGIEDHRALVILHKARLYDESQKRQPAVKDKVDKAIERMKPSGTTPPPKAKATDALRTRARTTGSLDDAAAYLDTLMGVKAS